MTLKARFIVGLGSLLVLITVTALSGMLRAFLLLRAREQPYRESLADANKINFSIGFVAALLFLGAANNDLFHFMRAVPAWGLSAVVFAVLTLAALTVVGVWNSRGEFPQIKFFGPTNSVACESRKHWVLVCCGSIGWAILLAALIAWFFAVRK